MCHENFTVEFGPNANFLVGKNGSGKSATITALTVGLGGTARASSRAANTPKLIKNGERAAKIEITLCNIGWNRFDEEHVGPHLTVVRHIRQSSSTYELKDERGRIVPRKLDDVKRLLRRFCIHVENPVFVLSQEASREFLKKLEPKSNFTLLMKATQLDICLNALEECLVKRKNLHRALEKLELRKQISEQLVAAEEEKLATLNDRAAVKLKLEEASTQLAWLSVGQQEEELANCEQMIQLMEAKKAKLEAAKTQEDSTQAKLTLQLRRFNLKSNYILFPQIADCRERIEKCQEERCELQLKLDESENLPAQYEAKKSVELKALEEITKQMESLEAKAHEVSGNKRTLDSELSQNNRSLQKMVELLRNQKTVKQDILNELAKARQAAELMGGFIETTNTKRNSQT
ncbi:GL18652 [Drosophila persimilis]|uniref:GL18652 n=1 Tax=Drosophila persimilis TaxID=7234 RepID=B4G9G7_DROPE|nr:GL18652 [Drosophila persimilis]